MINAFSVIAGSDWVRSLLHEDKMLVGDFGFQFSLM